MTDPLDETIAIEVLSALLADREGDRALPLGAYLERFPGREEVVRAVFARVYGGGPADPPPENGTDAAAPEPGARRLGPYRLIRELGRGAQGTVHLAEDERLHRLVALKVAPRSLLTDDLAPRLKQEARVAAALHHPGICAVYDVGHDDATAWIALRYVEGETLAERLAREGGPLKVQEAVRLIEDAARAAHAAHEAGIVHRDLKPANVMITPAGDPVLLDFGVARHDEGPALTRTGEAPGTPAYMAPECFRGGAGKNGRGVDVWALGVTLHEAATGRRPFEGPTRDALVQAILRTEPPPPRSLRRDLPKDLAAVLATALAKEVDVRYRTAEDLAEDLRRVREGEPVRARPAGPLLAGKRFVRRNPALAASLFALALVLVSALATTFHLLMSTRRALAEREKLLADFTQVSDQKVARDLIAEEGRLWPARSERVPDLERWLSSARALLERRPLHEAELSRAPREGRTSTQELWLNEQRAQLLADLDRLETLVPRLEARRTFAGHVVERTVTDHSGEWERARAAVIADPRFPGLRLEPIPGLVPLGPDPRSGLEEFAVLATGAPPARDATTGELVLSVDGALVLVLVPGGETHMGCLPPGPDAPPGAPYVDPLAGDYESPPQLVRLVPYLLAKHEMTQGQWLRHAGENPSTYQEGSKLIPEGEGLLHPVETVSWDEATAVLAQLGMTLPTEAQWEHAARAGTTSPWFTGLHQESLQGAANLADSFARHNGGHEDWLYEDWLDDGAVIHGRVGAYRPNAFGLHDVAGNVSEWCRDTWEDWSEVPPRDGDGLCEDQTSARTFRGGRYMEGAKAARSAAREGCPPQMAQFTLGVRPAMILP